MERQARHFLGRRFILWKKAWTSESRSYLKAEYFGKASLSKPLVFSLLHPLPRGSSVGKVENGTFHRLFYLGEQGNLAATVTGHSPAQFGRLRGRRDWQANDSDVPSVSSRSRYRTGFCYTSGWPCWRRISLRTSSGIADMPCPALYSYSWRIWSPLVHLLSTTPTITDEALSFILFSSTVQYLL